eukprot:symbB.v1.2.004070.t1/scaffold229.1/size262426/13
MVPMQRTENIEDDDQIEPEDEPETEEQRRTRYLRSEMCEVSDPDEWRLVHHGTGESETSNEDEEEAEINLDGTPGRPMTSTRFTTAQLRLLVAKGYYVFSDEEVQTIRDGFARDYIRPSFSEEARLLRESLETVRESGSLMELSQTIEAYTSQMNLVNISTAFHRIARLWTSNEDQEAAVMAQSVVEGLIQQANTVLARASASGTKPSSQALANITWAMATLNIIDEPLLKALDVKGIWEG